MMGAKRERFIKRDLLVEGKDLLKFITGRDKSLLLRVKKDVLSCLKSLQQQGVGRMIIT